MIAEIQMPEFAHVRSKILPKVKVSKMTIFDLHSSVLNDYRDFVRSFLIISDLTVGDFVEHALDVEGHLWPNFLLQISPSYQQNANVDQLTQNGTIHPETACIFRTPEEAPFRLYLHQPDRSAAANCKGEQEPAHYQQKF